MIRTIASALLLAGLSMPVSHAGAAQPEPAPKAKQFVYATPGVAGRSYLGVDIKDVTSDRLSALKLKEEKGVEITMVDADAPAGKAGLKTGDVILQFNGAAVESEEQLRRLIRETPPGRTVTLGISRDGNPMNVSVQLADHAKLMRGVLVPPPPSLPELPDFNRMDIPGNVIVLRNTTAMLGVQTENLTRQLGDFFGVKNGEGVLIRSVDKNSPAEKAGLKAGDVIVKVGDERLNDRADLSRTLRNYRQGGKVNLGVIRDKREQNVTVEVPERKGRDSSQNVEGEEIWSLMDNMDDFAPEIESAELMAQNANDLALLQVQPQVERALKIYDNNMKQYEKNWKNYQKGFEHMGDQLKDLQKVFQFELHDMI
jgi:membrane-associated protease RseP (regulator of RpoE activity)